MIFRRLMLVLIPLLAVGFVFAVMWYLYRDWEQSLARPPRPDVPSGGDLPTGVVELETVGGFRHVVTTDANFVRKDRTGRTESRFLADRIVHFEKHTADVERPRIQFFTDRDEIITLLAERARVVTKGPLMEVSDIESGRLWGNVVLVHDRGTPDDYADDILVGLEDLTFENDTYEMATDGPVILAGDEMTLSATKMRMALDPQTRRLNTMTFMEDILITFEGGDRLGVSLTAPDEQGAAEPASEPSTPPPDTPVPGADGRAQPSSPAAEAADETGSLWRIDLAGDVDARQADQRLRCDRLALYNRSRETGRPGGSGGEAPAGRAGAPAAPGRRTEPSRPTGPAERDQAAETISPLLTVVADGPLIITPVQGAEREALGERQHEVSATGGPVVVEDRGTCITGHRVRYNTRTGSGSVAGKEPPVRLEQPGELLLTGDRLDFDRGRGVVEVTGEGRLRALAPSTGLAPMPANGAVAPEEPDPKEPGGEPLDASWQRGLRLSFYRLPADASEGLGEIRQANFRGGARVKQGDGLLKGDDLTVEFTPAEADRGQAVRRLVGHGSVFLKNAPVGGSGDEAGQAARVGDIAAEDLDIRFARDAAGTTRPTRLEASGNVAINDPQGRIRAQDLTVTFGRSEEGETEARFLEARGNVLIDREDLHAEGDHVRRDDENGTLLLTGDPARARQGESRIVGPEIRFSRPEGRATVAGAGELELPATTDLRGRPRAEPEPLLVTWTKDMHFSDARHFARFDGSVTAVTGGTELACQRLWVHFEDAPPEPDSSEHPVDEGAADAAAPPTDEPGSASPATTEADAAPADDLLQGLFGGDRRVRLVRVLAEHEVEAVDQRLEEGLAVRHRMEITGQNLTYLEASRKAYMHGPGRLRVLVREQSGPDAPAAKPLTPDTVEDHWAHDPPQGYARTRITWAENMAFDGVGNRAYFQGEVDATHIGRAAPGEADTRRGRPTRTRITGDDLQVVFAQRDDAADTGAETPAETPADAAAPLEERLTIDKLIARGGVLLWVDDRRGAGQRLIYQRRPELIRLYRGPEPGDWARLWREDEATQEFGEIAARTITYDPSTGRVDVVDQQVITVSPRPTPVSEPVPKLVPGSKE